jgi:hypothetical protein
MLQRVSSLIVQYNRLPALVRATGLRHCLVDAALYGLRLRKKDHFLFLISDDDFDVVVLAKNTLHAVVKAYARKKLPVAPNVLRLLNEDVLAWAPATLGHLLAQYEDTSCIAPYKEDIDKLMVLL